MPDYQTLRIELTTDPLAKGYAGMSDAQAAASLMAAYRTTERASIRASELYEAVVDSEFTALAANVQTRVRDLYTLDVVPAATGSRARAVLLAIFGAGTQTRANLAALVKVDVRRCDEIGWSVGVTDQDVAAARAL